MALVERHGQPPNVFLWVVVVVYPHLDLYEVLFLNSCVFTSRHPPQPGNKCVSEPFRVHVRMETWLWSPASLSHATVVQANHLTPLWVSSGEGDVPALSWSKQSHSQNWKRKFIFFDRFQLHSYQHTAGWVLWRGGMWWTGEEWRVSVGSPHKLGNKHYKCNDYYFSF